MDSLAGGQLRDLIADICDLSRRWLCFLSNIYSWWTLCTAANKEDNDNRMCNLLSTGGRGAECADRVQLLLFRYPLNANHLA